MSARRRERKSLRPRASLRAAFPGWRLAGREAWMPRGMYILRRRRCEHIIIERRAGLSGGEWWLATYQPRRGVHHSHHAAGLAEAIVAVRGDIDGDRA